MKLTIVTIAVLIGGFLAPLAAFADDSQCELVQIANSNAFMKADPTCDPDTSSAEDQIGKEKDKGDDE